MQFVAQKFLLKKGAGTLCRRVSWYFLFLPKSCFVFRCEFFFWAGKVQNACDGIRITRTIIEGCPSKWSGTRTFFSSVIPTACHWSIGRMWGKICNRCCFHRIWRKICSRQVTETISWYWFTGITLDIEKWMKLSSHWCHRYTQLPLKHTHQNNMKSLPKKQINRQLIIFFTKSIL